MTPPAAAFLPSCAPAGRKLLRELWLVRRFLEDHRAAAVDRYGAAALEAIDLPPIADQGELVPAQIRAAGALLWASEVEQAGLPAFIDSLAEGVLEGKVLLPITSGADRLMLYRRARKERFSSEERHALYQRLFGEPGDAEHPFAGPWSRLLEALDGLARASRNEGKGGLIARAMAAARDVAQQLSERSGGIAAFAAQSISKQIHDAMLVLRDPDLSRALGGGSPWRMMRMHAQEVLGRPLDPERHLDRASAALQLCGWLADAAPAIEAGTAALPPPAALQAAELWLTTGTPQLNTGAAP